MKHHSRKLWLIVYFSLLIVAVGVGGAAWETFGPMVDTIIGSLVGLAAIFCGANITQKYVQNKGVKQVENTVYGKGGSIYEPGQPVEEHAGE